MGGGSVSACVGRGSTASGTGSAAGGRSATGTGAATAPGAGGAVSHTGLGVRAAVAAGMRCVAFPNENTGQHDFVGAAARVGRLDFAELQSLTSGRQEAR